ncbi:LTA synthase family protein [Paenibacillus lautus]|uniref:LTA synthase family protein n=1 Tax=Paenibacillus lautus TaxID=1401 RepID=UPI003D2E22CE
MERYGLLSKNKYCNFFLLFFVLILPLIIMVTVEWFYRGSLSNVFKWMINNANITLLNYILYLSTLILLLAMTTFFFGVALYFFVWILFALINFYKLKFLEEPFFPWDLLFANQIINLVPSMYKEINWIYLIIPISLLLISIFFVKYLPKIRVPIIVRITLFFLSLSIIISFGYWDKLQIVKNTFSKMSVVNISWEQNENYRSNGNLFSFFLNIPNAMVISPKNYNKDTILGSVEQIKHTSKSSSYSRGSAYPNIIYVMNEAFWDPTVIDNVSFSKEPLPYYKSLVNTHSSGWLLSPQFGGGTSNVEFEALTGLSMKYLPQGSMPYQQYIKKPFPSLAHMLKEVGYESVAIHSYVKWFWNRETVYSYFDFDKFVSDEDFVDPERRGVYIADLEVSKRILQEVEVSNKPMFIYAITMQNHSTYNMESKYKSSIKVNGEITSTTRETLEIYSQGVYEADQSLKYLLENLKEPTIVVFFGDHLPNLSSEVYSELEFNTENAMEKEKILKRTPLVIWSNLGVNKTEYFEGISPGLLIPYVYETAGIEMPLFYQYLNLFREHYQGISRSINMDSGGNIITEIPKSLENQYQLLQYDLLFGEGYSREALF